MTTIRDWRAIGRRERRAYRTQSPIISKGDTVRFKCPYPGDTAYPMRVIWTDSPRAMVEFNLPGWPIQPTQIVLLCDLEIAQ